MNPKFYSLLGLCQRAGRLVSGEAQCEAAIRSGEGKLIVLAEDASKNTKKKFNNSAAYYSLPLRTAGSKHALGRAIGKEVRAVLVVTDPGFVQKLLALSEDSKDT